jgi:chaperonin GroES
MKLNPLHDQVVVRRVDANTQSLGGIIIPDNVAEKPDQGVVVAVGPGRRNESGAVIPVTVKAEDKVLFGKHAGQAVTIKGEEVLILREEEIYAVIED